MSFNRILLLLALGLPGATFANETAKRQRIKAVVAAIPKPPVAVPESELDRDLGNLQKELSVKVSNHMAKPGTETLSLERCAQVAPKHIFAFMGQVQAYVTVMQTRMATGEQISLIVKPELVEQLAMTLTTRDAATEAQLTALVEACLQELCNHKDLVINLIEKAAQLQKRSRAETATDHELRKEFIALFQEIRNAINPKLKTQGLLIGLFSRFLEEILMQLDEDAFKAGSRRPPTNPNEFLLGAFTQAFNNPKLAELEALLKQYFIPYIEQDLVTYRHDDRGLSPEEVKYFTMMGISGLVIGTFTPDVWYDFFVTMTNKSNQDAQAFLQQHLNNRQK